MTVFDISELAALEILDSRGRPALAVCRRAGYRQMVSHRAPARGERVAKYNRLIEIAAATPGLRYGTP